jgi:hypothetical protein
VGVLARLATAARETDAQLQADVRASPIVHADETSWRESGHLTTVWTVSTPQTVYFHHGRRTNAAIDGLLTPAFTGTIVAD